LRIVVCNHALSPKTFHNLTGSRQIPDELDALPGVRRIVRYRSLKTAIW
jgi:hypothetical protein